MTSPHAPFYHHWIISILLSLVNITQGERLPLFERSNALCPGRADPPSLCTSVSNFETCTTTGDPCGINGLCVLTTEGEPICATDGMASLCFGSEYCGDG